MNTLTATPFQFESKNIRTIIENGEPLFVAIDVATALGYRKPHNAIHRHCKGSLKRGPLQNDDSAKHGVIARDGTLKRGVIADGIGRTQEVILIYEPDVYRLIVGSRLPAAQRFERWIFEDVLPSIRKTGAYVGPNAEPPRPVTVLADFDGQGEWYEKRCQRCRKEAGDMVFHIQYQLLAKAPLWQRIQRYHRKNLTNREIATLVSLSPAALRRQLRAMDRCGLLTLGSAWNWVKPPKDLPPSPCGLLASMGPDDEDPSPINRMLGR
jgi:prophage antirepressor-like protein